MNKKFIISMSVAVIMSLAAAYADTLNTTIYTDGIGRMHFLGRDAANNTSNSRYTNSAEQDLTRRLYENSAGEVGLDTTYDQHPLKNYENTFPDSRFNMNRKFQAKSDTLPEGMENSNKTVVTTTKGATDYSGQYQYGSTILTPEEQNVVKTTNKKHWWNRKKD